MDNQNRKLELLGNAPIPKALLAMGIPTMIGMLINALYNLVDAYFVGGLGESQMAAISVVYPLGQVVVGLGLLFGNGAASYISRLLGQRNKEQANKVASTALYSSLVVGAIMIVLSILFLKPILRLLGATESVLPYAATYAGIYIISCIFNVFNVTMNNIVTSEGAAKTTMCALLLGAVLNIGLDPLFIYTFNFGVAGAAIATAISQVVSTLVYLFYIFRQKSAFQFRIKDCTFSKEILSEIFKIGVPTLVFQLLTSISISLINNAAGYSYGAKKFDRLRTAIKISILWSTIFCVIVGLLFSLFSTTIVSQFTTGNTEMIHIGASSLRVNGITFMLFGYYTVYSSLFLALGKGKEGFILGACRQGICFIPVILIFPFIWGLNGILYAQPIADILSALITVFMAIPLHKSLTVAEQKMKITTSIPCDRQ